MAGTAVDSIKKWLPRLADALFPRRCPFCGALLGADALQGTVCPGLRARRNAAAAHPTAPAGRGAQLLCSEPGCRSLLLCRHGAQCDFALQARRQPLRARELADRMAVLVFGALPARRVGGLPQYLALPCCRCTTALCRCRPASRCPCAGPAAAAGAALGAGVENPGGNAAFGPPRAPARRRSSPGTSACKMPGARLSASRARI